MSKPVETTASDAAAEPEQPGEALATPGTVSQSLAHQLFRGHDPFAEFSADPFSSGGSHRIFGSSFGRVMQRLENLSEEILGVRPMLPPQDAVVPGAARYSVQTASMSAFVDEDGQVQTEQFASSDVGDRDHEIRETHQAYSNSAIGEQKRALEQHLGTRGMKTVKRRGGYNAMEESLDMFKGMENTAAARDVFTTDFKSKAEHLPEHQSFRGNFFSGFGAPEAGLQLPGAGSWRRAALEEQGSKGGA